MKKINKLILLITTLALTMSLVACGGNNANEDSSKNNSNVNNKHTEQSSDVSSEKDEIEESETEEIQTKPIITKMKESEAYVDFAGVKLPMDITYQEFLQFMTNNGWEWTSAYGRDEDDLPNEEKGDFTGGCYLNTNCGRVYVFFMDSEDATCSVLREVKFEISNISIAGITVDTPLEEIENALELASEWESGKSYYLDDYLYVNLIDDNYLEEGFDTIVVERKMFHMR